MSRRVRAMALLGAIASAWCVVFFLAPDACWGVLLTYSWQGACKWSRGDPA